MAAVPLPLLILPAGRLGDDVLSDFFAVLGRYQDSMLAADMNPRTLASYCDYISRAGRLAGKDPRSFTADDVDAVLATYADRGPAKGNMKRAMRSFYAWAEDRELLVNPARHVRIRKPKQREAPALERGELTRLLIAATQVDPRAPWALMLAYATGARLGSLAAATAEDVHGGRIYWRQAKNDDPYSSPLGHLGREAVAELLALSGYRPPKVASRRDTLIGVGPGQLWAWAHRAGELAGLHVWPHLLRHTFATDLIEQGTDMRTWQDLMHHKDLSQVSRYVPARDQRALAAVEALG